MTAPEDPYRSRPQPPAWDPASTWGQPGSGTPQGYGPPPPPYGYPPAAQAPGGHLPGYAQPQATSTLAIVALGLAIGSFFLVLPVLAIVALVLVPRAREEIDLSAGRLGGDALLTAAKVIAWIHIGLTLAAVLAAFAALSLLIAVGFS